MTRRFAAALLAALLTAPPLPAADPPATGLDYTAPAPPAPPDPVSLVLRLFAVTAALVTMCGTVVWLARRANRPPGAKGDGGGRLKHEGTLSLGRRCAVHLIRADGQTVAVTTDATGVRSIVILSEPFEDALAAAGG
jgi:hypothetical protein